MNKKEIEFLKESNAIEGEYSAEALKDSIRAWQYATSMVLIGDKKIDTELICEIHGLIMRNLNRKIAGKIRECDVWVGNRKGFHPKEIQGELKELCKFQPANPKDVGLNNVGDGAVKGWHIQFEKIHPFEDGNGRTGRILMNIQRLKIGLPILVIHEGEEQKEYYKWFKEIGGQK